MDERNKDWDAQEDREVLTWCEKTGATVNQVHEQKKQQVKHSLKKVTFKTNCIGVKASLWW